MSQVEEFVKIVEGVKDHDVKVVIVTGKPGSGKSKVLREAAEEKKWDYIDCRLLITITNFSLSLCSKASTSI